MHLPSQGAEEGWSVKEGAIAKTAEGKLAVVLAEPNSDDKVRLRFADDERSGGIKAASLTQATAFEEAEWQQQEAERKAKIAWCKQGAIAKTADGKL
eukprot:COSAG06_NODE_24928_length_649_cov_0.783636_1_plen_96_part_10